MFKQNCSQTLLIAFLFFKFSVLQFKWKISQTNNSIKSNKPNRITKKHNVELGSKKEFVFTGHKLMAEGMAQCAKCQLSRLPTYTPYTAQKSFLLFKFRGWSRFPPVL